jgi:hypothetical protein
LKLCKKKGLVKKKFNNIFKTNKNSVVVVDKKLKL